MDVASLFINFVLLCVTLFVAVLPLILLIRAFSSNRGIGEKGAKINEE